MKKKLLIILLAIVSLLSCGGEGEDNLLVKLPTSTPFLIPSSARSCKGNYDGVTTTDDISQKYFKIKNITLTWLRDTSFRLEAIHLSFQDENMGKYECTIADTEMPYLTKPTSMWDKTITGKNSKIVFTCPIICGGISPKVSGTFTSMGKIEFIGVETLENGDEVPVYKSDAVTVSNLF